MFTIDFKLWRASTAQLGIVLLAAGIIELVIGRRARPRAHSHHRRPGPTFHRHREDQKMSDLQIYVISLGVIFIAVNIYRLYKESKGEGED